MSDEESEQEVSDQEVEDVEEDDVPTGPVKSKRRLRKERYRAALMECLEEYKNILIVNVDNVGSKQMQTVRTVLRGTARVLMGKNTIIRKVLRDKLEERPELEGLLPYIKGNMGFVFTNETDLSALRKIILENKVPAAARSGAIAPVDVWIAPGPTGLDPGQTSFFQALSIATKIAKGSIEILNKVHLVKKDEKVSSSAVSLLGKLSMKPFFFGIVVNTVYEAGRLYDAAILDLTDDDKLCKWYKGVTHVAALSLVLGIPTKASISHSIINGFKLLAALALETKYSFKQLKAMQGDVSDEESEEEDEEEEDEEEK